MRREIMQKSNEVIMPEVELIIAGRLDIGSDGEHQIKSSLETDEQIAEYAHKVKNHLAMAEDTTSSVCIDGRGCRCLASEAIEPMPEYIKPPIRTKMEGGMVNAMTDSALLAKWSLFTAEELANYEKARAKVQLFLIEEGFEDAAHTADASLTSDKTTECGAWMKKSISMKAGSEIREKSFASNSPSALDLAVGAYNGLSSDDILNDKIYNELTSNQGDLVNAGTFDKFDPIKTRDEMKSSYPDKLEVLYSDPEHPTHNHKEPMLVIIDSENADLTIDRDAMYEIDGFAPFVDNRNKRRQLANFMGATEEEKQRILMAGDLATVDVGNQLFAPGMPVIVIK